MQLPEWLVIVILGIVEGATEFIPVSSTGHLLIVQDLLDYRQSDLFNVVIQSGAVLAVLPLFAERLKMMADWRSPASMDFNLKVLAAFVATAAGGLVIDKLGITLPETAVPVAAALIIGGIVFIEVEKRLAKKRLASEITWTIVFVVAAAQIMAAVFPGTSRSGATIIFAMMFGLTRVAATEFSFLVGIPTLLAAGSYKIYKAVNGGHPIEWGPLALGTVVAAVVSFIAVKWLLEFVRTNTFVGFGYYRIVLGVVLLVFLL